MAVIGVVLAMLWNWHVLFTFQDGAQFDVLPALAEVLRLRDTSMLALEITVSDTLDLLTLFFSLTFLSSVVKKKKKKKYKGVV